MKHILLIALLFIATSVHAAEEAPSAIMPETHYTFLEDYCLSCHDELTEEGDINLEFLSFDLGSIPAAEMWQKVLNSMNSGEMPPEKKKQPTAEEKTQFLEDLSKQLVVARDILSDSGGVITMRRLNRREYANTLRELLDVDVDVEDLPDDVNSDGFDTSGASLFFSSDQFEQYVKIGRRALDEAIVWNHKPNQAKTVRVEPEISQRRFVSKVAGKLEEAYERGLAWKASGKESPVEFGFIDADRVVFETRLYNQQWATYDHYLKNPAGETGALLYTWFNGAHLVRIDIPPKAPVGDYLIRVQVGVLEGAPSHRRFLEYGPVGNGQGGEIEVQGCREITGTLDKPQVLEFPVRITKKGPRTLVVRERQPNSRDAMRYGFLRRLADTGLGSEPALWVDWTEWEGPLIEEWPPASHTRIFPKTNKKAAKDDAAARKIMERFALKAFRFKKPSAAFVDKLMGLYKEGREAGQSFEMALKHPLSVVLASPSFLYLVEPIDGQVRRSLTDLELAIRLSYFMWSGPPDAELYEMALIGMLKNEDMLKQQVDRMLADPRAREFVEGFTHQWLTMDRLDFFQFNYRLYAEFDESVKEAARREVYETIHHLLKEGEGLNGLLKSKYVVINDVLADYYDIEGVKGGEFRVVPVPKGKPRGGLLGMAAVLAMGSDGERSSPVERGTWVMRKLLNDPPPPAPANVPQLSRLDGKNYPVRELLAAHMEEAQCAQCHRKIDPIGFGLENFDAAGKWRKEEFVGKAIKSAAKRGKFFPIDPSGTLPDGTEFAHFWELRAGVAKHDKAFALGFTESLIEYGLGRPFGFSDYQLAHEIVEAAEEDAYNVRTFIHALIQSKQFKSK